VVYLTAYNKQYYSDPKPKNFHPGHIATCFQSDDIINEDNWKNAKVIQAGGKVGVMNLSNCWSANMLDNVQAHLYLGYIIN
jgi:hypothetical protein